MRMQHLENLAVMNQLKNEVKPLTGRESKSEDQTDGGNGGDDENDECEYAGELRMKQAGIDDPHEFKRDFLGKKAPISHYDICACKDGSIKIKAQGACGKPGPSIETGYTWK